MGIRKLLITVLSLLNLYKDLLIWTKHFRYVHIKIFLMRGQTFFEPTRSWSFSYSNMAIFLTNYRFWSLATISEKGMILNWLSFAQGHYNFDMPFPFDIPIKVFSFSFTKIDWVGVRLLGLPYVVKVKIECSVHIHIDVLDLSDGEWMNEAKNPILSN